MPITNYTPSFRELLELLSALETQTQIYICKNFSQSYTDIEMRLILMINSYSKLLLKTCDDEIQSHPENVFSLNG